MPGVQRGGAGGGEEGGDGSSQRTDGYPGTGGSLTSGGTNTYHNTSLFTNGVFGDGGSIITDDYNFNGCGGGGGWFGGGAGIQASAGGGGGSGFVFTNETQHQASLIGYKLSEKYLLTRAKTISGDNLHYGNKGSGKIVITDLLEKVQMTYNCRSYMKHHVFVFFFVNDLIK